MSVLDRVFLLWIRRFVSLLYLDGFGSRFWCPNAPHRVSANWGTPPHLDLLGQGGDVLVSSCRSGSLFWSSWAPLGVVFGRSGGRFGAFSAFQLIDSTHQLINSSIQPNNSCTHPFNSSTHQFIDETNQAINSSIQFINSSTLEFWNSIPKVDELSIIL